jgi:hypothetical protein
MSSMMTQGEVRMVKKRLIIGIILAISCLSAFGDDFFNLNQCIPNKISFSYQPLGIYYYMWESFGNSLYIVDGFHELSLTYEYRLFNGLGFEIYGDFKGYKYAGYETNSNSFVKVWGLPNFKIGAGAVLHVLNNIKILDLSLTLGLEYAHYIADEVNSFPGFGISCRTAFFWKPVPQFGLGLTGALHYSAHAGGAYKDDPYSTRLPFGITELGMGLTSAFYF